MARRSDVRYDNTLPAVDSDYDPDLDPEVDRVYSLPPVKWSRAGRMDFADANAQREYLRLVDEMEQPKPPFFDSQFFLGVAVAVAAGAVVGWLWRKHREKQQRTPRAVVGAGAGSAKPRELRGLDAVLR